MKSNIQKNQWTVIKKLHRKKNLEESMLKLKKIFQFFFFFFFFFINHSFQCPYPNCGKYYATEVSLNLHIKIKHKGGNKTEREKYAVLKI